MMGGEWLSSRMKVYLDGRTGESKEWSLRPPPSPSDTMVSSLRRESEQSFTTPSPIPKSCMWSGNGATILLMK